MQENVGNERCNFSFEVNFSKIGQGPLLTGLNAKFQQNELSSLKMEESWINF